MDSSIFRAFLLISTVVSVSLGFPQASKPGHIKYRKVDDPSLSYFAKQIALFPVKPRILCSDITKCRENQENGIRVKKQLNFDEDSRLLDFNHEARHRNPEDFEDQLTDYTDLEVAENSDGRWKRSLLGRLFGYPQGHYRRRWWPARRNLHRHHHDYQY
ncbi:unnamed protein product [Allacma fusca]|uniref:Uncharacterized protein n=1 Tax=Allacma fusca TaxID=39272 RepID=A0A8J2LLV1_9HEXA|nr:unnamed protein product [Allacma fusca]